MKRGNMGAKQIMSMWEETKVSKEMRLWTEEFLRISAFPFSRFFKDRK
jgi:hypothetical protein